MMTNLHDHDILVQLLQKGATVNPSQSYRGKSTVKLVEERDGDSYSVTVNGVPDDTIIIKADRFPPPREVFNGTKGETKRADFILISSKNARRWIVHVEIKGARPNNKEIVQQLKGAQCLVAYCRAIGRIFWESPKFLDEKNYQQRFVSITDIKPSINKKGTRIAPSSGLHNTPENKLRIKGKNPVQFAELVGRPGS